MSNRIVISVAASVLLLATGCNSDPETAKKKYVEKGNSYAEKGRHKEAIIMYRNALKKDARYGEAYYRLALTELKLGRPVEAVRDLNRTIELQPENLDAYNKLSDLFLKYYLGNPRRPKGYIKELQSIQAKLKEKFPNSFEYARLSGYLALTDRNIKEALTWFEKANSIKPLQQDVMLVYFQALEADGRGAEAERVAYDALKRDPKLTSLYDALYVHYLREKKPAEAERTLQTKRDSGPKVATNYLQLAAHYFSQQRRPEMLAELNKLTSNTKDFPNAHRDVGDFYLRTRDMDKALDHYNQGIKQDPKLKPELQKRIIEILLRQNKREEASQLVAELLKENPNDQEGIAIRASLSLATGTPEQIQAAITDLRGVVTKNPENAVYRTNLGRALLAKGDIQPARVEFEEAIKRNSKYVPPRVLLTQILMRNRDYGKSVQMTQEILSLDPSNLPARLMRTQALVGAGNPTQARQELNDTLKKFPDLAEAKLQLASLDLAERNPKSAQEAFRKLYETTKDRRAFMGLVQSYVSQNQVGEATKLLQDELSRRPECVECRVSLGTIAARSNDPKTALAQFQKLVEMQPASAENWMRLGETQRLTGDLQNATASFTKAKDLAPTSVVPYVQLGLLFDTTGKKQEAKPMYEKALSIDPNNPIALNNLAFMLAENGDNLDQALTMAQKAKQQQPQDANIADTLGWIYIKKNLHDSAIPIFRDLITKNPQRATFRYHLAMALAQKGDKPQARKELEAALRSNPPKDEEAKIRELMGKIG